MPITTTPFSEIMNAVREEVGANESSLWLDDTDLSGFVVAAMRMCGSSLNGWNYSVVDGVGGKEVSPSIDLSGAWGNALISAVLVRAARGGAFTGAFENFGTRTQNGLAEDSNGVAAQQRYSETLLMQRWEQARSALMGYQVFVMGQV